MAAQRIAPDGLDGPVGLVCLIVLTAACGGAQIDPVGSLIAGSSEALRVDEGLDPVKRMCIKALPVLRENSSAFCQQM